MDLLRGCKIIEVERSRQGGEIDLIVSGEARGGDRVLLVWHVPSGKFYGPNKAAADVNGRKWKARIANASPGVKDREVMALLVRVKEESRVRNVVERERERISNCARLIFELRGDIVAASRPFPAPT